MLAQTARCAKWGAKRLATQNGKHSSAMTQDKSGHDALLKMKGATLGAIALGRDAISITLQRRANGTLIEYVVTTYGRVALFTESDMSDEEATAAALPELYRCMGTDVEEFVWTAPRRYKLTFVNGKAFEISDQSQFGDYTMLIDVVDQGTGSTNAFSLLE